MDEALTRAVVVAAWFGAALIALILIAIDPANAGTHALALALSMFMAGKEL